MHRIFPKIRAVPIASVIGSVIASATALVGFENLAWAGDGDVTIVLQGGQDNTLYETDIGNLSNGMGQYLFVGRTGNDGGNRSRRALLKFDFSAIPPGAVVQSADFVVTVNQEPMNGGAPPTPVTLHRLNLDWGEGASDAPGTEGIGTIAQPGDATWLHTFFDTDFWVAEGGDFNPTASAMTVLDDPGVYTFSSNPQMVADVQAWVDDPNSNFGWILIGNEGGSFNARRLSSFQNPTPADAPALALTYTPLVVAPNRVIPALSWQGLSLLALLLTLLALFTLRNKFHH